MSLLRLLPRLFLSGALPFLPFACGHDSPPDGGHPDGGGVLEIVHFDVGEGDATLIVGPEGTSLLMDGGPLDSGAAILRELQARNVGALDYLVISHPDADHIGGLDEVIRGGVGVGRALSGGSSATTTEYAELVDALWDTAAGVFRSVNPGDSLDLGGGAQATCTASGGKLLDGRDLQVSEENDRSVALHVRLGGFDYHVGGDLGGGGQGQADVETPLGALVGDLDVLHLHHHGSDSSTNAAFLNATSPEVAVLSVGENGYGHPAFEVVQRLQGDDPEVTAPVPEVVQTGHGSTDPGQVLGTFSLFTDGESYTLDGRKREVDQP